MNNAVEGGWMGFGFRWSKVSLEMPDDAFVSAGNILHTFSK